MPLKLAECESVIPHVCKDVSSGCLSHLTQVPEGAGGAHAGQELTWVREMSGPCRGLGYQRGWFTSFNPESWRDQGGQHRRGLTDPRELNGQRTCGSGQTLVCRDLGEDTRGNWAGADQADRSWLDPGRVRKWGVYSESVRFQ